MIKAVTRHHLLRFDYWRYWWRFVASIEAKVAVLLLPVALAGAFVLIGRGDEPSEPTAVSIVAGPDNEALGTAAGELRASVLFNLWARSNPRELERYEEYEADVLRGFVLREPEMVTPLGRALVAALTAAGNAALAAPSA